jgi:hypothetical protein
MSEDYSKIVFEKAAVFITDGVNRVKVAADGSMATSPLVGTDPAITNTDAITATPTEIELPASTKQWSLVCENKSVAWVWAWSSGGTANAKESVPAGGQAFMDNVDLTGKSIFVLQASGGTLEFQLSAVV